MSKPETVTTPSFKSEFKRIWNLGPTEQAWGEAFMLPFAVYKVGKDALWNFPRTVALTVGHTARRLHRQTNPVS
jgi:hypothetical protein